MSTTGFGAGVWSTCVAEIDADHAKRLARETGRKVGPVVARSDGLHGITTRDDTVRALRIGEQPISGDLLPDGKVGSDGTLQPYPEDVARERIDLGPSGPAPVDTSWITFEPAPPTRRGWIRRWRR